MIKKRKNIRNELILQLFFTLFTSELILAEEYFANSLHILYQGTFCNDCDQNYLNCTCEWCDECRQPRCICDIKNTISSLEHFKKFVIKFAKKNLTKIEYNLLVNKLRYDASFRYEQLKKYL